MKFARVKAAFEEKQATLKSEFKAKDLAFPPKQLFIRVFKKSSVLEVWVKDSGSDVFELFKEFKVCAASGELGPKRRIGDEQVPEGFYHISGFNPVSNFHLSLRVSYPNDSDKVLGARRNLGGDIFIHGNCVSIGCLAITDDGIKQLYVLAAEATSAGQQAIPVHIFPAKLTDERMTSLRRRFKHDTNRLRFWANLKEGFDSFEKSRKLPSITVDRAGRYVVRP